MKHEIKFDPYFLEKLERGRKEAIGEGFPPLPDIEEGFKLEEAHKKVIDTIAKSYDKVVRWEEQRVDVVLEDKKVTVYRIPPQKIIRIDVRELK